MSLDSFYETRLFGKEMIFWQDQGNHGDELGGEKRCCPVKV